MGQKKLEHPEPAERQMVALSPQSEQQVRTPIPLWPNGKRGRANSPNHEIVKRERVKVGKSDFGAKEV